MMIMMMMMMMMMTMMIKRKKKGNRTGEKESNDLCRTLWDSFETVSRAVREKERERERERETGRGTVGRASDMHTQ